MKLIRLVIATTLCFTVNARWTAIWSAAIKPSNYDPARYLNMAIAKAVRSQMCNKSCLMLGGQPADTRNCQSQCVTNEGGGRSDQAYNQCLEQKNYYCHKTGSTADNCYALEKVCAARFDT